MQVVIGATTRGFDVAKNEQRIAATLRPAWELNLKFCLRRGVNLRDALSNWTVQIERTLDDWLALPYFRNLTDQGCHAQVLALCIYVTGRAPEFVTVWRSSVGGSRRRGKVAGSLRKAADALQSIAVGLSIFDENELPDIGNIPTFQDLTYWLRAYARLLDYIGDLKLGALPLLDICKFGLTAYVKAKTGRFHDREVASLIGFALRNSDYDEASHKMWRNRNFDRLQRSHAKLPVYISAFEILLRSEK